MSTEIKPGDEIVTIQDAPTLLGFALPKGTHGTVIRSGPPTPAPLDPKSVHVGDWIRLEDGPEADAAYVGGTVSYINENGFVTIDHLGTFAVDGLTTFPSEAYRRYRLTDHQPAPEPEREWKPGTTGTATISNVPGARVLRAGVEGVISWWVAQDGCKYDDSEVTDFVPDELRPLPTRNDLVKAMHDDYLKGGEPRLTVTAREHLADAVLTFLRGESR